MRFDTSDLWRGFWKVLRRRDYSPPKPDYLSRIIVVAIPLVTIAFMIWSDATIKSPGAILTGAAIVAGGSLTAFTHLSTLRIRLTERADSYAEAEQAERDLIDEIATLLLCAVLIAVAASVALVVAMTIGDGLTVCGPLAWIVAALASLVVVLFLLTVPRMYNAYVQINKVRTELNGADRRREARP